MTIYVMDYQARPYELANKMILDANKKAEKVRFRRQIKESKARLFEMKKMPIAELMAAL